ncbi:hypothetical protein MJO10_28985, partial [Salmonella enterica subsp. enterica serovar Anatum]|nr:hypothetical protein [Salmonella enterica subsp. enterica serovar Anatum]
ENQLADDSLHGFSDIWLRLSRNFTPESALFRHAVRMSLVLCISAEFAESADLRLVTSVAIEKTAVSQTAVFLSISSGSNAPRVI